MVAISAQKRLARHVARLIQCRRCPRVVPPPVSGGAILSDVRSSDKRRAFVNQCWRVHLPTPLEELFSAGSNNSVSSTKLPFDQKSILQRSFDAFPAKLPGAEIEFRRLMKFVTVQRGWTTNSKSCGRAWSFRLAALRSANLFPVRSSNRSSGENFKSGAQTEMSISFHCRIPLEHRHGTSSRRGRSSLEKRCGKFRAMQRSARYDKPCLRRFGC